MSMSSAAEKYRLFCIYRIHIRTLKYQLAKLSAPLSRELLRSQLLSSIQNWFFVEIRTNEVIEYSSTVIMGRVYNLMMGYVLFCNKCTRL
jgi:hypothetical protein